MNAVISQKINNVNLLCTILIVCLHALPNHDIPYIYINTITDIAVPTFFTISGYLYFVTFNWNEPISSYLSKLKKRTFSLLIPYFVFSLFFFFYHRCLESIVMGGALFDAEKISEYLIDIIEAKADAPLWYLLKLYYFCLFAPIVGFVVKMTKWSILLMPFLGVVGYCYSSYTGLLFWLPCLLLGCWLSFYGSKVTIPIRYRKISLLVLILFLVVFLSSFNSYNDQFTVLYYIYRQITPIILIGVYMNYDLIPYKAVDLVGPYSMFIYCTHIQLLYPVSKLLVFIPQPVHYVFKVLIVLTILVAVGFFLRKSKKVWRIINGGR